MQVSVDTDCHFVEWVLWGKELNQEASSKNDHSWRSKSVPPLALSLWNKTSKNPNQTKPKPSGKMELHWTKLRRCRSVEKPGDRKNLSAPTPYIGTPALGGSRRLTVTDKWAEKQDRQHWEEAAFRIKSKGTIKTVQLQKMLPRIPHTVEKKLTENKDVNERPLIKCFLITSAYKENQ